MQTFFFTLHSLLGTSTFFDRVVYFFAEYMFFVVGVIVIYVLFSDVRNKTLSLHEIIREIIRVTVIPVSAWLVATILKNIVLIPRPFIAFPELTSLFEAHGYSFPSGHATILSAVAAGVYILHPRLGIAIWVLALFVGTARVIAGVHYPIDIIAGLLLGPLLAFLYSHIVERSRKRREENVE